MPMKNIDPSALRSFASWLCSDRHFYFLNCSWGWNGLWAKKMLKCNLVCLSFLIQMETNHANRWKYIKYFAVMLTPMPRWLSNLTIASLFKIFNYYIHYGQTKLREIKQMNKNKFVPRTEAGSILENHQKSFQIRFFLFI